MDADDDQNLNDSFVKHFRGTQDIVSVLSSERSGDGFEWNTEQVQCELDGD